MTSTRYPALQALVRANRRALLTIAEQPQLAIDYIASFLDRLTREEVLRYYERHIGPYFTSDGRVDLNVAQHEVDAVATELGIDAASVDQMYQPARPQRATAIDREDSQGARTSGPPTCARAEVPSVLRPDSPKQTRAKRTGAPRLAARLDFNDPREG
jgi:hypothetical protein